MDGRGYFIQRINRFVVELHLFEPEGKVERVYLPNPGRLWELFYKGSELLLKKARQGGKYSWQIEAVIKEGKIVFLHTLKNNDLAEHLLRKQLIPGLEDYRIIRREVASPIGKSRFDFLLEYQGEPCYLEVKSCSLFQGKMAMFPDAPTLRGRDHLLELGKLKQQGYRTAVLIIVQSTEAEYFLPEYHTDPDFAGVFQSQKENIQFYVAGSQIEGDLTYPASVKSLRIPWEILQRENKDRGAYMVLLELEEDKIIETGALGPVSYSRGFYIYVGSALKNLQARLNRHLRKRKKFHWHLDYLRDSAVNVKGLPLRSSEDLECELASSIKKISAGSKKGFGSSDCSCDSHLFFFTENPLHLEDFIETLLYYRMERPLEKRPLLEE